MQNIRSSNTKPELLLAKLLRKEKVYFARHVKSIVGRPDFVFRRKKVLVFIDSDFWHCHPKRFIMPKSNLEYWRNKIERNKTRDKFVNIQLKKSGWKVLRFWEYDVKNNQNRVIKKIINQLGLLNKSGDYEGLK